jgi:hypothetical protein
MTQQQRDDALKAALGTERSAEYASYEQQAAEVHRRIEARLRQGKKQA